MRASVNGRGEMDLEDVSRPSRCEASIVTSGEGCALRAPSRPSTGRALGVLSAGPRATGESFRLEAVALDAARERVVEDVDVVAPAAFFRVFRGRSGPEEASAVGSKDRSTGDAASELPAVLWW